MATAWSPPRSAELGLTNRGPLNGTDVEVLSDEQLEAAVVDTTIFARISPTQKSRIVKAARPTGNDVGYFGDGVNDAVAVFALTILRPPEQHY